MGSTVGRAIGEFARRTAVEDVDGPFAVAMPPPPLLPPPEAGIGDELRPTVAPVDAAGWPTARRAIGDDVRATCDCACAWLNVGIACGDA